MRPFLSKKTLLKKNIRRRGRPVGGQAGTDVPLKLMLWISGSGAYKYLLSELKLSPLILQII
jgi:hypothetical protein